MLAGYFAAKALLRGRAGQVLPEAVSLVPSALWPWRFYGLSIERRRATTCTVDAWARVVSQVEVHPLCDPLIDLERLPEYRAMQELSVGFVPTTAEDGRVVCRDLRTRNFGTQFGRLTVNINGHEPVVERFDV